MPETMKAALIRDENGFNFTDVPFPVMKDGDILIKIHAAGVNRADIMQRHGTYPPPPGWPEWPGLEVAGEVYAVSEKIIAVALYGLWNIRSTNKNSATTIA